MNLSYKKIWDTEISELMLSTKKYVEGYDEILTSTLDEVVSKVNEQFLITAFNDDRQVYEANITVIDFLQQVQSACEQVVLIIGRHHYEVNDYNKFLMKIKKLKTLIQKMIQPI